MFVIIINNMGNYRNNRIFCLSLKKNATTYLHKLFLINGYTSVHGGQIIKWINRKSYGRYNCIIYANNNIPYIDMILKQFRKS